MPPELTKYLGMPEIPEDAIRLMAFRFWKMRGGGDGFSDIDWILAQRYIEFYGHYHSIARYSIVEPKPRYLEDSRRGVCRFCKRCAPEAKFSERCHAVPHLLGNKSLFVRYECDDCNAATGKRYENALGILTNPSRTLTKIEGKSNSIPKYKSPSRLTKVESVDSGFHISLGEGEVDLVTRDDNKKQLVLRTPTARFIPIRAFKSLVKIALMLLPEEETTNFSEAFMWLTEPDESRQISSTWLTCIKSFSPIPVSESRVFLFRRRGDLPVPYATLVLATGHLCFQIPVPLSCRDYSIELEFPIFPVGVAMPYHRGVPTTRILNLSGTKEEVYWWNFTIQVVGEIKHTPPPGASDRENAAADDGQ